MTMTEATTQSTRLLQALEQRPLTTLEIITRLGIIRPAAVVHILRGGGWTIETEMIEVQNRWREKCKVARYTLTNPAQLKWKPSEALYIPEDGWTPGQAACTAAVFPDGIPWEPPERHLVTEPDPDEPPPFTDADTDIDDLGHHTDQMKLI